MAKERNNMSSSSFNPDFKAPEGDFEKFMYAVSHDLQEPLRMMTSFMKLIESRFAETLPEDGSRYLEMAMQNADRMKKM
ncbi:MAG: histidine kinase, partial [Flavobacteriales bacterium]|nr:histidine kinase [Flavobacteriales bacterium]